MAQILIRNLDEIVVERLKERARARGTSLEHEARSIITDAVALSRKELAQALSDLRARQKPAGIPAADLIREDRRR
jgi:plasmid stability protein